MAGPKVGFVAREQMNTKNMEGLVAVFTRSANYSRVYFQRQINKTTTLTHCSLQVRTDAYERWVGKRRKGVMINIRRGSKCSIANK